MKKKIRIFLSVFLVVAILLLTTAMILQNPIYNIIGDVKKSKKEALTYYVDDGNVKYTVVDNTLGGYTITEMGNYLSSSYTVPSNVGGYNINVFGSVSNYSQGIYSNANITELTIPNTINYVQSGIFNTLLFQYVQTVNYNVTNFSELGYNSDSAPLTNPSYSVFGEYNGKSIAPVQTINIGNGVRIIPASFAANAVNLKKVNIPNTVTEIRDNAFYRCLSLQELVLPSSVTKIGNAAFQFCNKLQSIYIPSSVTSIASNAFSVCNNLTIKCLDGSYAAQYARANNIPYEIVDSAPVQSISIASYPSKTTYIQNSENLNLSGGYLKITYTDGTTETISMSDSKVSVSGFDNTTTGTKNLTVTYGGKTTTFNVTIVAKELTGISVKTNPSKTSYIQNKETLDLTGGKITLTYNDSSTEEKNMSDLGVSVTGFDNRTLGTKALTVTYGGKTATFNVTIVAKELMGISVKTNPSKTTYIQNYETLDLTGGKIILTYNDSLTEEKNMSDSGVSVTGFDNTTTGTKNLTVTYGGKTTTFNVTIVAKELMGISVKANPSKTSYIQNKETLDLTGGKITLTYNDSSTEEKNMSDSGVSVTGFDNTTTGTKNLTVTYGGKTTTFNVTIVAKELTGISVKTNPSKTSYIQNKETLDLTGGKITLTYNNSSTEEKNMSDSGVSVTGFDNTTLGNKEITLTYEGKSVKFNINVIQNFKYDKDEDGTGIKIVEIPVGIDGKVPSRIEIPSEIDGKPVTELDKNLFKDKPDIDTIYIPETVTKIPEDIFDGLDDVTIECKSGSKAEEFAKKHGMNYELIDKIIDSISIHTKPTKTSYKKGETGLDITGGRIKLTYTDGTDSPISMKKTGVKFGTLDTREVGKKEISVEYKTKTTAFDVEVTEEKKIELGDINGDGQVNSTDLLLLKRHIIAGSKTEWILTGDKFKMGDINSDEKINATDLLLLKRKIVNK